MTHGEFYYLFVSFDHCCRGVNSDYKVMVGRSRSLTGPYVDRAGKPMLEGGGTLVLAGAGTGRLRGPGHNAILRDGDKDWFVHHYYDARLPRRPDAPDPAAALDRRRLAGGRRADCLGCRRIAMTAVAGEHEATRHLAGSARVAGGRVTIKVRPMRKGLSVGRAERPAAGPSERPACPSGVTPIISNASNGSTRRVGLGRRRGVP